MNAVLREWLWITNPGASRDRLKALATFTRRGRVRPGDSRVVGAWVEAARGSLGLPRGLLPAVRQAVWPERLHVQDRRLWFDPGLDFGWQGTLRPEQYATVAAVVQREGGSLVALTGAGKTVMGLGLIAWFQQPALWVVHRTDLARDALAKARTLFDLPASAFGYIGEDEYLVGTHVTFAVQQTLARRENAALASTIGTLVVDEHQHSPAPSVAAVVSQFAARYRVGMTATLEREDGLHSLIHATFGPWVRLPDHELIRRGRVMIPTIRPVPTAFTANPSWRWADLQRARAADRARNIVLLNTIRTAVQQGHHTLVLVALVDHAQWLARQLTRNRIPAQAVVGAVQTPDRDRAYRAFLQGRIVLVATSLADEGLDLPAASGLVLGTPGRSRPKSRQQIGRIMRLAAGKRPPVVWDLVDGQVPALAKQWQIRRQTYRDQGWDVVEGQEGSYGTASPSQ